LNTPSPFQRSLGHFFITTPSCNFLTLLRPLRILLSPSQHIAAFGLISMFYDPTVFVHQPRDPLHLFLLLSAQQQLQKAKIVIDKILGVARAVSGRTPFT
jgi:hypothetical protein